MTAASHILRPSAQPADPTPNLRSASPGRGRFAIWLIRAYQLARAGRVSPCRFTPSCSEYAAQAISLHGTRRGLGLAARRLARCRPHGPFGYDPVPPASE